MPPPEAASRPAAGFTEADFAAHLAELRKKLPAKGFTVVVEPPFVVIGDEPAAQVKQRAEHTVRWAVDHLKKAYFEKDPPGIIDVWLLQDDASYRKHAKEIFGDEPDTPYGYFSHQHRALIMNIRTGGGTLVHEIVHPYIAANFPECPSWRRFCSSVCSSASCLRRSTSGRSHAQPRSRSGSVNSRMRWSRLGSSSRCLV